MGHNSSRQHKYKAESPSHAVKRSWEDMTGQCGLVCVLRRSRTAGWGNPGTLGSDFMGSKNSCALTRNEVPTRATTG